MERIFAERIFLPALAALATLMLIASLTATPSTWAQSEPAPANESGQSDEATETQAAEADADAQPADAQANDDPANNDPANNDPANNDPANNDPANNGPKKDSVVGWLELSGTLREGPVPYAWVAPADAQPSVRDIVHDLERVASRDQYAGVVLYLDRPRLSLTQATAIADAIQQTRAAGKKVFTFAEQYDTLTYLVASSADQILLQHHGRVRLSGLSVEELYVAGLLSKIGVQADLMQIGQFKGAQDPLTRTEPSEAWNQNMDSLLDDLYDQILTRIAGGREMTRDQVKQLMAESWAMTDRDYLKQRVVDRLTDRELTRTTAQAFGNDFTWDDTLGGGGQQQQQAQNPFALFQTLFQEPQTQVDRQSIAVLHATGPVTSGESSRGDGLFASNTIGSQTMIEMLRRVRNDPMIKGAVIRINSPGGSALASEVIWQAVRRTADEKPVYISVGRLAASGGYYIASAGEEIYVSPQSIVGSIGVVGGKIVLGDLYEKLDLHVHRRNRGPMADMFNSVEPFTEKQRTALRQGLERVYTQFTDRVSTGRGDRIADLDQVVHGRVFTGRQSVDNGLTDKLGGLDTALADVATAANLKPGDYDVLHLPPPMSLGQFLDNLFGSSQARMPGAANPWLETARQTLGPRGWQASRRVLTGLMLLREEPALTLMPYVLIAR